MNYNNNYIAVPVSWNVLSSAFYLTKPSILKAQVTSMSDLNSSWLFSFLKIFIGVSVQFSSVAQSCPTLCDPMNRSTPGLPVHHQPTEFTQAHAHRVGDAIRPSHPLSSPFPPAPSPSQHQGLFQWVNSYWSIVDFKCWVSFRYSAKWINYTCIHSFLDSFPCRRLQSLRRVTCMIQ